MACAAARRFKDEGVPIRGVVLNKVMPQKVDMVREKMGKLLRERWGVPLLGVVPDKPYLGRASSFNLSRCRYPNPHDSHRPGRSRRPHLGPGSGASSP